MRNDIAGSNSVAAKNRPPHAKRDNSDEALLAKIAAGNRLAMQVLYARHHARVYRFVMRLAGDRTLATDILTDVFLSAWRHAESLERHMAVSTWLIAIARRKAHAALRRRVHVARAGESGAAADPGFACHDEDRVSPIRSGLMRLSREHREIIDLVYYHRKSAREIADIVGISEAAVESRMHDARRRLSQLLQGDPKASG